MFNILLVKYANIDINVDNTKEKLLAKIKENHIEVESDVPLENLGFGNLVDVLYKKVARPHMLGPVYLTEHPTSLSPLNTASPMFSIPFGLIIGASSAL